MLNIIKVILFVLVNVAGFYMLSIIAAVSMKMDIFPSLPPGYHMELFKYWYFGGGTWVLILCVLISTGYFFVRDELKNWLLFAPMLGTGLYGFAAIIYFSFIYTIT